MSASSSTPGSVEGYWLGSSGAYEFGAVVLPNGATYVAYKRGGVVEGVMIGKTSANSSQFAGSVVDFNAPARAVTSATLAGDYARSSTMSASARIGSTTRAFTASFDPTYLTEVDLSTIAGTWTGTGASKDGFTSGRLQIAADGTFSGCTPLCGVTGTLSPIAAGKHPLLTVSQFSGGSCPLAGMTITGIAVVSEASGRRQMLTTGIAADQSDGFFGLLTRQ